MLGLAMQVARVGEFGLGEGVDGSGVTTKILTCNCSVDLLVENKSKLFGLHIHPPTMDLFFGRLPFAISHGRKLYAQSSSPSWFQLSVGTRSKPMYGAGRNMQDLLESGMGLPLVIRLKLSSNFRVVWNLIKPRFHHQAECLVVLDDKYDKKHRTQKYNSTCTITSS
ncbi:delta-latroinsectotoxin-Lt1a protein [Gossypium australe]|uniref:Delta-latroinsectotoxin-Lt1a protein n=1 Tax=Gossypium australe TaxID=47621 RepID=A0A5B6VKJ0_9ROSI|nr:delta-latroinsectotoxin-Lt1a protein [Gossypium australe]